MLTIKEGCYKGTRISLGNTKRYIMNQCVVLLEEDNFQEISIPIIQPSSIFEGKVGKENNNLMYTFTDRGGRNLCLAPEYTAVVQNLSKTTFKQGKDIKLFYFGECFRGEKPQAGRYRQFTQLGVEILNPTNVEKSLKYLQDLALGLSLSIYPNDTYKLNTSVRRGLDYYKGDGFEVILPEMGSAQQITGGGVYEGGVGFAIGFDRLLNYGISQHLKNK